MRATINRRTTRFVGAVGLLAVLFCAVWISSALLLTHRQNVVARQGAFGMMQAGIRMARDRMTLLASHDAFWTAAQDRLEFQDIGWIYDNVASGVSPDSFDLFAANYASGESFGWLNGAQEREFVFGLLPDATSDAIRAQIARTDGTAPSSAFFRVDGDLWLLASLPVQAAPSSASATRDAVDPDAPIMTFGMRFDDRRLQRIASDFQIDGARVLPDSAGIDPASSILLRGPDGDPVAAIGWTPPAPGTAILQRWWLPALVLVVAVLTVTAMIGRFIVGMAACLTDATDRAWAADRAKSVLLANVSHELRTPMNGIVGAVQLLAESNLDASDRELVAIIESSAGDQLQLIEQLLQTARLDAGEEVARPEPVDVAALLAPTLGALRLTALRKGLTFDLRIDPAMPPVVTDPRILRQAMNNLVGNALKFTTDGRVSVNVVWTPCGPAQGDLTIVVRDTGIGISPADLSRIFERFAQADHGAGRSFGGTGLGLSITRTLVQSLGGDISVQSNLGQGSTFTLRLPGLAVAAPEGTVAQAA
ncbi:sensory box sensor histidine kinase/response regulator [Oceaniovalibus guishaninsula JLT2003]|uniref:histidine kinase n=1 Tax=Oceaniovalibus guishaninsula JLT2003 TaxID=1231392 RepID=K2H9H9_9RHOB|nr:ATP-binding protein [Oceaniovalibus guishaninsula]EKE44193.1 sensory box sensor histidine kinase/response regulator [Oceaniovalibus guishaninsula JLT2003]